MSLQARDPHIQEIVVFKRGSWCTLTQITYSAAPLDFK